MSPIANDVPEPDIGSKEYHAGAFTFRLAGKADDADLRSLLRQNPMNGKIQLSLERAPSYFAGTNLMGTSTTVIVHDLTKEHALVGMYNITSLPCFINGSPRECHYLGGLRIKTRYRNRIRLLKHGFKSIHHFSNTPLDPFYFTSITRDNRQARRLLKSGTNGLPAYTALGNMDTLAISTRQGQYGTRLRQAERQDIPRIVAFYNKQARQFQLAPQLSETWLKQLPAEKGLSISDFWLFEKDKKIQAVMALWNQSAFKQTRIQGYTSPLKQMRPLYNLVATLRKRPLLPTPGCYLDTLYLAFFACDPAHFNDATSLIREALDRAAQKGTRMLLLGFSPENALYKTIRTNLRATSYHSCIEHVRWDNPQNSPLLTRPIQPEIALL